MRPIDDAVIVYRNLPDKLLRLGNAKGPFGLDHDAANDTLFTACALSDAFVPAHNFGFAIGRHGKTWTIVTGVFGGHPDTGFRGEGLASTNRATWAPVNDERRTLHRRRHRHRALPARVVIAPIRP